MRRKPGGLTLAELLVVLVLLLVGASVLIPALLYMRAQQRKITCQANLRRLGEGLAAYSQFTKHFPYGTLQVEKLLPEERLSWYVGTWEFVGLENTKLLYDENRPWNAPPNLPPKLETATTLPDGTPATEQQEAWYFPRVVCPANPTIVCPDGLQATSYVGLAGLGEEGPTLPVSDPRAGIWAYNRQTATQEIRAGPATTILLAETSRNNGPWTAGGPPTVRPLLADSKPLIGPGGQFGGMHPGGANVLFADTSVRFLNDQIDPAVLCALVTVANDAEHTTTEKTAQQSAEHRGIDAIEQALAK